MIEGMAATILIWIFAKQFCALFGITGGETLSPSISALRIVSLGFVFCSTVPLTTSLAVWDRAFVRMFQERCPLNARALSGCCKNLVPD